MFRVNSHGKLTNDNTIRKEAEMPELECQLIHTPVAGVCINCGALATHDHGDNDKFCCDHN